MLLVVEGRPAAACRGMAAGAAQMQRDREIVSGAGGQDRPVALAPQWLDAARRDVDLTEAAVAGALLDLGNGTRRVLDVDLDGALQPLVGDAPVRQLPFID